MKKLWFAACICALLSSPALASSQTSTVGSIGGDNSGGAFAFWLTGTRTGKPSCASADDNWVISNPSSDNAKALLSLILTAFAAGKTVIVQGTGACDATQTTREAVAWIIISN